MTSQPSAFLSPNVPVCPEDLLINARAVKTPRVAIARAGSDLPMSAAKQATQAGLMTPVFTGEPADIKAVADRLEWDISKYPLIETKGEEEAANAAALACSSGKADVLMKGQLHSDVFIKAALSRDAGLRTESRLVHVFHISPADGGRPLLISDAAVNVAPSTEVRQAATVEVVLLLHSLGNDRPKIAFLSATESVIKSVPSSVEANELALWARENIVDADFSGPLALDLILSPEAAKIKGMTKDPVAGYADAVIVPDIVSGNTLFKSLVYLSGGCAAGIVLGAKVPLLLTSRADPPAARIASVALAAIVSATKNPPD